MSKNTARNKSKKDTISEEVLTEHLDFVSSEPEEDSPGDSESDSGKEFVLGLNYLPDEDDDWGEEGDSDPEHDEVGITATPRYPSLDLPASVMVVSSDPGELGYDAD